MVGSGGGSIDYNQLKDIIIEAIQDSGLSTADVSAISSTVSAIADSSEDIAEGVDELNDFLNSPSEMQPDDFSSEISGNNNAYNNAIDIPNDSNPNSAISTVISDFSTAFTYGSDVSTVSIPIPFVQNKYIVLRSDIISRYIENSAIYTFIQLLYTFVFAKYFIRLAKRIIDWLERGEAFTEGGFSKFMSYLSEQNAVINASLM